MQMINLIHPGYKKNYINPYRNGVLIGNFVEEMIGTDLKQKYQIEEGMDKSQNFVSESQAQFQWPKLSEDHIQVPGNDLTMKCNSNFDLNIDFNKKNIFDYMNLQHLTENEYQMNNKNLYLKNQIRAADITNKNNNPFIEENIRSQTQSKLKQDHLNDSRGILYTKKSGLVKNLFFGHGKQKDFEKNEYATTYLLTMDKKENTNTIYDSKYKPQVSYFKPPKQTFDTSDWPYRKFKIYNEFTKIFDKTTNLEK